MSARSGDSSSVACKSGGSYKRGRGTSGRDTGWGSGTVGKWAETKDVPKKRGKYLLKYINHKKFTNYLKRDFGDPDLKNNYLPKIDSQVTHKLSMFRQVPTQEVP